jgi:hypothetical protein
MQTGLSGRRTRARPLRSIDFPSVGRVVRPRVRALADLVERYLSRASIAAQMSRQAEVIVAGRTGPQERCIALAEWIAATFRNATAFPDVAYRCARGNAQTWFAHRYGLCGERAEVFLRLADIAGIYARRFNLYNFGGVGGGHTAVQAFYEGGWHFFDPSYSGYFLRDGSVLSWEMIAADPHRAIDDLVVIESTLDVRATSGPLAWVPVDNRQRMAKIYTHEHIAGARSAGFADPPGAVPIFIPVDASGLVNDPLILGKRNGSFQKLEAEGVSKGLSEQLGTLGTVRASLHHVFEFRHAIPGRRYYVRIVPARRLLSPGRTMYAVEDGCEILEGHVYAGRGDWLIRVRSEATRFSVRLVHKFEQPKIGVYVASIEIACR